MVTQRPAKPFTPVRFRSSPFQFADAKACDGVASSNLGRRCDLACNLLLGSHTFADSVRILGSAIPRVPSGSSNATWLKPDTRSIHAMALTMQRAVEITVWRRFITSPTAEYQQTPSSGNRPCTNAGPVCLPALPVCGVCVDLPVRSWPNRVAIRMVTSPEARWIPKSVSVETKPSQRRIETK